MLERRRAIDGTTYYASPLLEAIGVRHAFSTRLGGESPPPFDSLNLGNPMGCAIQDDDARIQSNYQRLQRAIDCGSFPRRWVHQVHGGVCLDADLTAFQNSQKADAIVTRNPSQVIAVRIADCVPILLSDATGRTVAAVHAGWRGVIAGVLASSTLMLCERSSGETESLLAAIGPCISQAQFEVGPEVVAAFDDAFGDESPVIRHDTGKGHVDLRAACRLQLLKLGVRDSNIDMTDRCTVGHADEFFSHRRDHGVTGRMAALIAPNEPAS